MGARRGFLTAGTWCLDRNRSVDRWPAEDTLAVAGGLEERAGGSAANFALVMKKLDPAMPVATLGLVGDDAAGRTMLREATTAGIDCAGLRIQPGTRSHVTDCFVSRASGQRTHITDFGVGAELAPADLLPTERSARHFHLGLPGVHPRMDAAGDVGNGWAEVLRAARHAGFVTDLELCSQPPERQRALVLPCLPHCDVLVVNDSEIAALAGIDLPTAPASRLATVTQAAAHVMEIGALDLLAVHFPEAALVLSRAGDRALLPSCALPSAEIVGPNGAGDAFAAGLFFGLHEGWGLEAMLALGHAAAACSLRGPGAADAVPSWRDALRLAEGWGRRPAP